jgi:ATP/maltotriose-dependent transcriptional regulator MalT
MPVLAVLCLLAATPAAATTEVQSLLDRSVRQMLAGQTAQAEEGFRAAAAASEPKSVEEADSLNGLAWVLIDRGEVETAERLAQRALKIGESHHGKYSWRLVPSLNTLAEARLARGDFAFAESFLRRATRLTATPGAPVLYEAAVGVRRGLLWLSMGRYHEAEPLLEKTVALTEERIGADHPALAPMLHVLARCYRLRNRLQDAAALDARVAALGAAIHGANLAQGAH